MKFLNDILFSEHEYALLLKDVENERLPLAATGLSGVHKAAVISALFEHTGKKIAVITPDEATSAQLTDDLKSLGVNNYDLCIVAIGNDFQSSLETTSLLKELGAKVVISRASRDTHAKFLLRNGADQIIYPEKQVASWAAIRYSADHILDFIEIDERFAIFEVTTPEEWIGKTIGQIDIRKKFGINIMAIKQDGKMSLTIHPDTVLKADETMLVLGEYKDIQKCFHI